MKLWIISFARKRRRDRPGAGQVGVIVDFAGVAGGGKSTIFAMLRKQLRMADAPWTNYARVARAEMNSGKGLPDFADATAAQDYGVAAFTEAQPVFMRRVHKLGDAAPNALFWTLNFVSAYYFATRRDHSDKILLLDEGFLQYSAYLCAEAQRADAFPPLIAAAPAPDHTFWLKIDVALAASRAVERRLGSRQAQTAEKVAAERGVHELAAKLFAAEAARRGGAITVLRGESPARRNAKLAARVLLASDVVTAFRQ